MTPATFDLRAAVGAREATRPPLRMATPKKRLRLRTERGVEILEPGRDRLVFDHPAVRSRRHFFRATWNGCSPRGREAQRLERELREIERKLRTMPATNPTTPTRTPTPLFGPTGSRGHHIARSPRPTRHAPWRI
jgi:hypothetical protein